MSAAPDRSRPQSTKSGPTSLPQFTASGLVGITNSLGLLQWGHRVWCFDYVREIRGAGALMSDVVGYPSEALQQPSFASVANMIGDPRLAAPLAQLKREVRTEVDNAGFITKPKGLKQDLEWLRRDARRFEIALSRVSKRLIDLPTDADQRLKKASEALSAIAELCNNSLRTISNAPGARRKPGRVTCALIVIEAFTLVKDRVPSANNSSVQSACEDYWQACGGRASDLANWRRMITTALKAPSPWRRHIRDKIWQGTE